MRSRTHAKSINLHMIRDLVPSADQVLVYQHTVYTVGRSQSYCRSSDNVNSKLFLEATFNQVQLVSGSPRTAFQATAEGLISSIRPPPSATCIRKQEEKKAKTFHRNNEELDSVEAIDRESLLILSRIPNPSRTTIAKHVQIVSSYPDLMMLSGISGGSARPRSSLAPGTVQYFGRVGRLWFTSPHGWLKAEKVRDVAALKVLQGPNRAAAWVR